MGSVTGLSSMTPSHLDTIVRLWNREFVAPATFSSAQTRHVVGVSARARISIDITGAIARKFASIQDAVASVDPAGS